MIANLADRVTRHHRLTVMLSLLAIMALSAGASRLGFSPDFRSYFSDDNPQLLAFEALEADFNKRDNISILIEPIHGNVFTAETLSLIQQLTDLGWQIPYSRRVDSLSNHQQLLASADGLEARHLIGDDEVLDEQRIASIRDYASNEPNLAGLLVAADGSAAAVQITLTLPDDNPAATAEAVAALREALKPIRQQYAEQLTLHLFGSAIINLALEEAVMTDLSLLIPLSTLIIYGLIFLFLRSFSGLLIVVMTISFSIAMVFGLFGWAGLTLTPVAGMIPNMVMIIAVADCIHLLVSYYHFLQQQADRQRGSRIQAARQALQINFKPMLITSLTTAIGFLFLNFSEAPPYRALGNMAAAGAILAFLLSITLVPALLSWLPAGKSAAQGGGTVRWQQPMARLADWVLGHRRWVLAGSVLLTLLAAVGIERIALMERWHQYYGEHFAVRQAMDFQNDHLQGLNFIQYRIRAGANGINDPDFLANLAALHDWLAQQPGVSHVEGLLPQLKKVHRLLNIGSDDDSALPASRERAAQNLLLYQMSLPMGLGLEEYLDHQQEATRIGVFIDRTDSRALLALDQRIRDWAASHTPALQLDEGTGLDMVFAHISERNMISLLKGTALALLCISLLMVVVLRSWRLGLLSLVPNLLPALIAYGIWGLGIGYIDLGLSVVACMSLGLVVDDTVHFLIKYQHARKQGDAAQAIRYAFSTVGVAMVLTTVILVIGFAILIASPFSPTWGMGALLALTIALALLLDLMLLPALLVKK